MQCLYCGVPLAILRTLADGAFCCDEHRHLHEESFKRSPPEPPLCGLADLGRPQPQAADRAAAAIANIRPSPIKPQAAIRPVMPPGGRIAKGWPPQADRTRLAFKRPVPRLWSDRSALSTATPLEQTCTPLLPRRDVRLGELRRVMPAHVQHGIPKPERGGVRAPEPHARTLQAIWHAVGHHKLIAVIAPLLLLLTLNAARPRLYKSAAILNASSGSTPDGIFGRNWQAFRKRMAQRAAVDYSDDFRAGLDQWVLPTGSAPKWEYDSVGFVRPGGLALFRPTLRTEDCEIDFGARIDRKALGFVFRAADASNYQAVRLVITKGGALPEVHLIRYAVIDGREGFKTEKPVPSLTRTDTFFNVHVSVRGNDLTLMIEGKVADFWTDDRVKAGGVGFFCGKGESARIRRVQVSHQNDALGRLCAYIASERSD